MDWSTRSQLITMDGLSMLMQPYEVVCGTLVPQDWSLPKDRNKVDHLCFESLTPRMKNLLEGIHKVLSRLYDEVQSRSS